MDKADEVESVWWYWLADDIWLIPLGRKSWLYVIFVPGPTDDPNNVSGSLENPVPSLFLLVLGFVWINLDDCLATKQSLK